MQLLKYNTATTLKLGPFVDAEDAVTPETGLTIAQADIQISKNGGAFAQTSASSPVTTHDADGWYPIPLTATDTGTLGRVTVQVNMSGALPVWVHATVVPANVYDALVGGTDKLEVDAVEVSGDSAAADNLEADYDGTGYDKANSTIGTCTTNTDMVGTNGALTALPGTAPTNWINAAAIASESLNGKGDWSIAGDAMALTASERTTLAASLEAAIINELDGTAVMQAIADLIASDMNTGDLSVVAIASATRDAILDRVLSGNHTTSGTLGLLAQKLDITGGVATETKQDAITAALTTMQGPTFDGSTDSLEAIRNQGDAAWTTGSGGGGGGDATLANQTAILAAVNAIDVGSGSGVNTVTVTVTDGAAALQNARVTYTEGVNGFTATTDASGQATLNLDDATYVVAIFKDGYQFAGTTDEVNADAARSYAMTQTAVAAPGDPGLCAVVGRLLDNSGQAIASGVLRFEMVGLPTNDTEGEVWGGAASVTTEADGSFSVPLVRTATYRVTQSMGTGSRVLRQTLTVSDAGTMTIPSQIGLQV